MLKVIREIKELAEFYDKSFIDILSTYIFNPREYNHIKIEMIKYKLITASKWENT